MSKPFVSVIIPCRNEVKYISKNIDSILKQNYEGEIEVLIVDGLSDDGTRDIVEKYSNAKVRLIDNPEKFTPHAMNIGVDISKGDIFIILGGHAYLDENFVRLNVESLENDASIGCSGGQIISIYENKIGEIISKAMSSSFGVGNVTFRTGGEAGFVDTVAFGAYYKKVHYDIGKFDECLVRNQDDEYNFKLVKSGRKVFFDPRIISYYFVRGSFSKLYKQYFQYGYWKVYVNAKHKTITTLRQIVPLFFVLGLIGGFLLTLLWIPFYKFYLLGLTSYLILAIYFGQRKCYNFIEGFKISAVFPILHFSYGLGYLQGIINFIILNKKPSNRVKTSSRN
jgi:glycosyltransferase involved in cell wall biosynthesis